MQQLYAKNILDEQNSYKEYTLYFTDARIGSFIIKERNGYITNIFFSDKQITFSPQHQSVTSPLLQSAVEQLRAYCTGKLITFSLPIKLKGSPFQEKVWEGLLAIPYGTTCSYSELATSIGCTGAARAVGNANNKNPIPIIVPCHRVIGANGTMTGYNGGIARKKALLAIEANALGEKYFPSYGQ